jgi:iron complex outermembrane recepter protein
LTVVDQSFATVTIVTPGELLRNGGKTLGDQLTNLPGVSSSGFAPGGASRPVIRGLDNFRIRVQENGIGSQDVSDLGEDHGIPIDPLAAQRVEIIRGPAITTAFHRCSARPAYLLKHAPACRPWTGAWKQPR